MPVTDPEDQLNKPGEFRKKALSLSEEFASIEGRRPRILVGKAGVIPSASIHKICNAFADMGFDVDMAPEQRSVQFLASQSLENDSDMILICSDSCLSAQDLMSIENDVLPFQSEMIISLMTRDAQCKEILKDQGLEWKLFSNRINEYEMGYSLLVCLMTGS